MEAKRQDSNEFLRFKGKVPIADVRTPLEYEKGHIPGAVLFPLFSNEERAEVGKLYALHGKERAVEKGFEIAGPKLKFYLNEALRFAPGKELSIYCWRGGMRSASIAWLLGFSGFKINLLEGGYKAYRRYCHNSLSEKANIIMLGGFTGSGKTESLDYLEEQGEQVIKLEALSNHKGSVFGWIGEKGQPSQEQFENDLSDKWQQLDLKKTIWIEDESINIGVIQIPRELFQQMESAPVIVLETPRQARVDRLVEDYKSASKDELKIAFDRINKRIGGKNYLKATEAIDRGENGIAADIALEYYDKAYASKLESRKSESLYNIRYENGPKKLIENLISCKLKLEKQTIQNIKERL